MSDRLTDEEIECIGIGVSVGDYGNDGLVGRLLDEVIRLRERQETHLRLISDLSKTEISREHAARLDARIAALVAEVGTLRAELAAAYERCAGIAVRKGRMCQDMHMTQGAQVAYTIADNIRALIK